MEDDNDNSSVIGVDFNGGDEDNEANNTISSEASRSLAMLPYSVYSSFASYATCPRAARTRKYTVEASEHAQVYSENNSKMNDYMTGEASHVGN